MSIQAVRDWVNGGMPSSYSQDREALAELLEKAGRAANVGNATSALLIEGSFGFGEARAFIKMHDHCRTCRRTRSPSIAYLNQKQGRAIRLASLARLSTTL